MIKILEWKYKIRLDVQIFKKREEIVADLFKTDYYSATCRYQRKCILKAARLIQLISEMQSRQSLYETPILQFAICPKFRLEPLQKQSLLRRQSLEHQLSQIQEYQKQILKHFLLRLKQTNIVKELIIAKSNLTDELFQSLCKANLSQLTSLNLSNNCLTHHAIKLLSKSKFNWLEILLIDRNPIGNKGLESLCKFKFKYLKMVDLSCTNLTSLGILFFERHYKLGLERVVFQNSQVDLNTMRQIIFIDVQIVKLSEYVWKRNQWVSIKLSRQLIFMNEVAKIKGIQAKYIKKANSESLLSLFRTKNKINFIN